MKALKVFNTIALAIPIFICFISLFDKELILFALLSLIATGAIQTIVAAVFWFKNRKNRFVPFYFLVSILFFVFAFGVHEFDLEDVFTLQFWLAPAFLCIYLSWIIYTHQEDSVEQVNQS